MDEITRLVLRGEREELVETLMRRALDAEVRAGQNKSDSPAYHAQAAIAIAYREASEMIRDRITGR